MHVMVLKIQKFDFKKYCNGTTPISRIKVNLKQLRYFSFMKLNNIIFQRNFPLTLII